MPVPRHPAHHPRQASSKFKPVERANDKSIGHGGTPSPHQPADHRHQLPQQEQPSGESLKLVTPPADHRLKRGRY